MSTDTELAVIGDRNGMQSWASSAVMPIYDIQTAIARRNAIVEFTKAVMIEGQDYGKIPGTDKNTLLKPGAEKLVSLFGLTLRPVIIDRDEDWTGERHGGEPLFRYLYGYQAWKGDTLICEAHAECNSWESKYRYRNAERVCPSCGKPAIIVGKPEYGGGFVCFKKKGGCGLNFTDDDPSIINQQVGKVPNPDVFGLINTIIKMAAKRALVAVTLLAVNASEFFTQDVEDMDYIDVPFRSAETISVRSGDTSASAQSTSEVSPEDKAKRTAIKRAIKAMIETLPDDQIASRFEAIEKRYGDPLGRIGLDDALALHEEMLKDPAFAPVMEAAAA